MPSLRAKHDTEGTVPRKKKSDVITISEGPQQSIFPAEPEVEQPSASIDELRVQSRSCKACDLWKNATQTVFGEGSRKATIMFVGEQPGDQEDLAGHPFVGPAGKVLDDALAEAGIERSEVYVTNAVKHFKWVPAERGKRRIHKKPRTSEVQACRPWLEAEVRAIRPQVLVALGATAAQSLFGKTFSVTRQRGELVESPLAPYALATVHPSSILRAPDEAARHHSRTAPARRRSGTALARTAAAPDDCSRVRRTGRCGRRRPAPPRCTPTATANRARTRAAWRAPSRRSRW